MRIHTLVENEKNITHNFRGCTFRHVCIFPTEHKTWKIKRLLMYLNRQKEDTHQSHATHGKAKRLKNSCNVYPEKQIDDHQIHSVDLFTDAFSFSLPQTRGKLSSQVTIFNQYWFHMRPEQIKNGYSKTTRIYKAIAGYKCALNKRNTARRQIRLLRSNKIA